MNPSEFQSELTPEERDVALNLSSVAEDLQPNNQFIKKTEAELRNVFAAKKDNRMQRMNLIWQSLAGATAIAALTLLILWLVKGVAPDVVLTPVPAAQETSQSTTQPVEATPMPTATPSLPVYERWGTTVYRAVEFPAAPAEADLYPYPSPAGQSATLEAARAFALRFGMDGVPYDGGSYGYRYLFNDGRQSLYINSEQDFLYLSGKEYTPSLPGVPLDVAQPAIDAFLQSYGFNFAHQVVAGNAPGWFTVVPLTADGLPMFYGPSLAQGMSVALATDGQILQAQASLFTATGDSLGKFSIISAEEAWQKFLDDSTGLGVTETSGSQAAVNWQSWSRVYPDDQPVTFYCVATISPALEVGISPLITCGGVLLSGNLDGLGNLDGAGLNDLLVVQGQFKTNAAGGRELEVERWEKSTSQKTYLMSGEVRREGDRVILTSDGADYVLPDVPADFPIPALDVGATGVIIGDVLEWEVLGIHMPFGGGGGGGGAFARINLSGSLVPWPTPEPIASPTPNTVPGQRLDGIRGDLQVFIYQKSDSSQVMEYRLGVPTGDAYIAYILQGADLSGLNAAHNRPVDIWGTVTGYTPTGNPIVTVERSVIPYPDLKFQVLSGTEQVVTLDGLDVILLTTEEGQTYVEFSGDAPAPSFSLTGVAGESVNVLALLIPNESFGGYPAARVFGGGPASETTKEQVAEMPVGLDKPYIIPGDPPSLTTLPALTIERIELGYYISDPRNPPPTDAYLQPAWHFYGRYDNGDFFECVVQALVPELLYPEPEPFGN